jgi:hypothetical protein
MSDTERGVLHARQSARWTDAEYEAQTAYVGGAYTINSALREGHDASKMPYVKDLDSLIASTSIPRDTTVFRGVHGNAVYAQLDKLKPGESYIDKGYSSTSTNPDKAFGNDKIVAAKFTPAEARDLKIVQVQIALPKGSKGAAIGDHDESELLLPRNQKFTVQSIERHPDGRLRSVHVIADGSADKEDAADDRYRDLITRLSPNGRCATCDETEGLEVDHIDGRDWSPRDLSRSQRAEKYWDEYNAGVKMQALCRSCNGRDGALNKQGCRSES